MQCDDGLVVARTHTGLVFFERVHDFEDDAGGLAVAGEERLFDALDPEHLVVGRDGLGNSIGIEDESLPDSQGDSAFAGSGPGLDPEGIAKARKGIGRTLRQVSPGLRTANTLVNTIAPTDELLADRLKRQLSRTARDLGESVPDAGPIESRIRAVGSAVGLASPTTEQAAGSFSEVLETGRVRALPALERLATQREEALPLPTARERLTGRPRKVKTPDDFLLEMRGNALASARVQHFDRAFGSLKSGKSADNSFDALFRLETNPNTIIARMRDRQAKDLSKNRVQVVDKIDAPRMWQRYFKARNFGADELVAEIVDGSVKTGDGDGRPNKGQRVRVEAAEAALRAQGLRETQILRLRLRQELRRGAR